MNSFKNFLNENWDNKDDKTKKKQVLFLVMREKQVRKINFKNMRKSMENQQ